MLKKLLIKGRPDEAPKHINKENNSLYCNIWSSMLIELNSMIQFSWIYRRLNLIKGWQFSDHYPNDRMKTGCFCSCGFSWFSEAAGSIYQIGLLCFFGSIFYLCFSESQFRLCFGLIIRFLGIACNSMKAEYSYFMSVFIFWAFTHTLSFF